MLKLAATNAKTSAERWQDDDAFVAALDLKTFRDAPTIARHMLQAGNPASLAMIRERMNDYVEIGGVEARGASWRIEPPANDNPSTSITLRVGDCLDLMRDIPDGSIDLIVGDLPYGVLKHRWDIPIDLGAFWREVRRIGSSKLVVLMFGRMDFCAKLIASNEAWYRYDIVWQKTSPTGFVHAKTRPLTDHEHVLVFSPKSFGSLAHDPMTYHPQTLVELANPKAHPPREADYMGDAYKSLPGAMQTHTNFPRTVVTFASVAKRSLIHKTQKPVDLLEYLIRTYSDDGAMILDPTAGSGSTAVGAWQAGRSSINFEKCPMMAEKARMRIERDTGQPVASA